MARARASSNHSPVHLLAASRRLDRDHRQHRLALGLAATAALATTLVIYVLRLDRVVGLVVDDAWYVLLAKALATGQGYSLINSPTPGITPLYPPGFPAVLSIVFHLSPAFPDNVWLLKSVSIAAMIGAGLVSFRYFETCRALPTYVAFALAFATAIHPALAFMATSTVMSECVFTFTQLATILVIEGVVRRAGSGGAASSTWRCAAGGALASLAFLTRSAGLGLVLGGAIYLLERKLLKQALVFAGVVAVLAGPWTLYSVAHVPTPEQQNEQAGNIVLPYSTQFWNRVADHPDQGVIGVGDLPGRIWGNLNEIGRVDIGAFVFYSRYRPLDPREARHVPDGATRISLLLALVMLAGYIAAVRERVTLAEIVTPLALAISLSWGWEQIRLLLPLLPLFLFYLVVGVGAIARSCQRLFARAGSRSARGALIPVLVVSWAVVVCGLYDDYEYLRRRYDPVPEHRLRWIRAFDENESFMAYIEAHIPKNAPLAAQNPALLYLYTGHETVAYDYSASRWELWKRLGVRYVARTGVDPVELFASEARFPTIYRSDGFLRLRLLDLGPPESRPAWAWY
jgi:hypothetical protein